jgi:steroid 5-alpha reductase family enzyme
VNIVATAFGLIITLLVVPVVTFFTGSPLGPTELAALRSLLWLLFAAWAACFVLGELTGNVSQVDKLWSLLPIAYTWIVAVHGDFSPRLLLMAVLISAWGLRLTYNFSRHGGYRLKFWTGHEDYRWQVLRQKPEFQPRWKWTVFNLLFISGYQNVLLLLITLPALLALQYAATPLGWVDFTAAVLLVLMLVIETIADQQQWRFQVGKKALLDRGEPLTGEYARGFLDRGLWAWSRHPNYFAEQGIWIAFYLFSVAASGRWFNWSICGSILLILLFRGSSRFSEEISAAKYPDYASYRENVARFFPLKLS